METKFDGLLLKLEKQLATLVNEPPNLRLKTEILMIRQALAELQAQVSLDNPKDQQLEIEFFKCIKPKFYSQLIFAIEYYNVQQMMPLSAGKSQNQFLHHQLEYISRFFRQHEFFYQYYRLGGTELDEFYFIRGAKNIDVMPVDFPELDQDFATIGDYLFSKFMALEKLQLTLIDELKGQNSIIKPLSSQKGISLNWTGETTNLIELIYGLVETKQFNQGEADISDLVDVFQQAFNCNLSNYFRRFTTIKRRKSISKTKFLDQMRDKVAKRIDDADAYVPAWAK